MSARSGTPARSIWIKRLAWIAGFGVLLAVLPLLIALVGLAIDNMGLQTFHWLLYFSMPAGLLIAVPAGTIALVLFIKGRIQNRPRQS